MNHQSIVDVKPVKTEDPLTLDDLGFSPVVRWTRRSKSIGGWLLAHTNDADRDIQIIYINHDGQIQFAVMEKAAMDHNQNAWNIARDYYTLRTSSTDPFHSDDHAMPVGHAPSAAAEDIMEPLRRTEFREHLSYPNAPTVRKDLLDTLNLLNILDANVPQLAELVRTSSAKAEQVLHQRSNRTDPDLTSGLTSTNRRLTLTGAIEPKSKTQSPQPVTSTPHGLRFTDHMHTRLIAALTGKGGPRDDRSA